MYLVLIRQNATGEERWTEHEGSWEEGSVYLWEEGNYSCDCNRALFFARAASEDDPDQPCGNSAYTVVRVGRSDGTVEDF